MRRSSTCFMFASVALLFAGGAESQSPSLNVEISVKVPRVGDEVIFTCIVTGIPGETLTLNKVIVRPEQKFMSEQIAINDVLVKPYKDLGRFRVTKTTDGEAQKFVLTITAVQVEDSGHYACGAPGVDNLYAMEIVEVYQKPHNVSFAGYAETNALVVVQENEKANLVCVVPEVLPIPSVQVWLERAAISPKDITDQFLLASELNVKCSQNPLDKTCPMHMSYTVLATNRDFIPSFIHDGKQLTCSAKMKELDFDEKSSTITLTVIYPPKFLCAGLWNGTVNQTDLRIICQVYANPPSGRSNKSATVKAFGRLILIRPGESSPEYSLEDTPLASTDLKVTSLEFVIKTVTEEHFTYVYYLYAVNEAGNTTKEIRIAQTMTPLWDSADSLRSINVYTVILSIFFALAFSRL